MPVNKKRKRNLAIMISAVTATAVGAGITQALLTARPEPLVNHINIVGTDSIKAELLEPKWDGIIGYEDVGGRQIPVYEYRDD